MRAYGLVECGGRRRHVVQWNSDQEKLYEHFEYRVVFASSK